MPTNEERREVAARLLNCASLSIPSPIPFYLKKTVHDNYPHWITYSDSSTLERLASLIEPEPERTCEFEPPISGKKRCKRCGAFISYNAVWDCFGIIPARFCPNCGAKVVK